MADAPRNDAPEQAQEWTTVIRAEKRWFDLDLRDLWRYRDLVLLFVHRDFASLYKQTVLGPLWLLLQPLLMTAVYAVVFGELAALSTDGTPKLLFYLSGVVAWRYFSDCLTRTSQTFRANAHILGKVYFPRLVVPLSIVVSSFVTTAIQFALFLVVLCVYLYLGVDVPVRPEALAAPLVFALMALMGLGAGITVSSVTTKYRDLSFLVGFGMQLMMYATPVIYPLSMVPEKYHTLMLANPMTPVVEYFRFAFLGTGTFRWEHLGVSALITLALLVLGVGLFSRVEKTFMDTV